MDIPQAVPQALRGILDSLSIAGLPTSISAGEVVKPRVSPALDVFDFLTQEQTLAKLDLRDLFNRLKLTISLTDVTSSLRPEGDALGLLEIDLNAEALTAGPRAALGRADLEVVLKDVEYNPTPDLLASNIDTGVAPARSLPHASPSSVTGGLLTYTALSSLIKGMVGKVAGFTGQFEKLRGGIGLRDRLTGTVTTTLRTAVPEDAAGGFVVPIVQRILDQKPHVEVTWRIEDENGRALNPGEHFYLLEGTTLGSSLPALTFLPDFVEYSPSSDTIGQRRIFCHVVVYATAPTQENPEPEKLAERTLPPITVAMPRVEIPTVLAVTEHAMDRPDSPGAALIVLPLLSEVRGLDKLAAPLLAAQLILGNLEAVLPSVNPDGTPIPSLVPFHKMLEHINTVLGYIRLAPEGRLTFVRADKILDIWWIPRNPGLPKLWYESFEDMISSIVLLGPPGRAALFHKPKELAFKTGGQQGVFQLTVGPTGVAAVRDLGAVDKSSPDAACEPSGLFGSRFEILVPVHADSQKKTFNDEISSLQFAPMG